MQTKCKAEFCRWVLSRQEEGRNRPWCSLWDSWNMLLHEDWWRRNWRVFSWSPLLWKLRRVSSSQAAMRKCQVNWGADRLETTEQRKMLFISSTWAPKPCLPEICFQAKNLKWPRKNLVKHDLGLYFLPFFFFFWSHVWTSFHLKCLDVQVLFHHP